MKEVVHFTYDIEFVISTGAQIYIEKILYNKKLKGDDDAILINGKPYSVTSLKFLYADDRMNKTFDKKIVDLAVQCWDQGATITDSHFRQLAIKYLEKISSTSDQVFDLGDSGYVYDRNEKIKINVSTCDHYDAAVFLAVKFVGGPNKLRDLNDDRNFLCDYIFRYIIIVSDVTNKKSVISDLRSSFTSLDSIIDRFNEVLRDVNNYIEYLKRKGLEVEQLCN